MRSGKAGVCGNIRERALGVSEAGLILSSGGTDVTDRIDKVQPAVDGASSVRKELRPGWKSQTKTPPWLSWLT